MFVIASTKDNDDALEHIMQESHTVYRNGSRHLHSSNHNVLLLLNGDLHSLNCLHVCPGNHLNSLQCNNSRITQNQWCKQSVSLSCWLSWCFQSCAYPIAYILIVSFHVTDLFYVIQFNFIIRICSRSLFLILTNFWSIYATKAVQNMTLKQINSLLYDLEKKSINSSQIGNTWT